MRVIYEDQMPIIPRLRVAINSAENRNRQIDRIELNPIETRKLIAELTCGLALADCTERPECVDFEGVKVKLKWSWA